MAALRDVSELLWPSVQQSLAELGLLGTDTAAAKLAQRYAQVIDHSPDQAWALRWIGPLLLQALDSLGATPASRAALTKGVKPADVQPTGLAKLRAAK